MHVLQRVGPIATLAAVLGFAGNCFPGTPAPAAAQGGTPTRYPQHILIIRHAEKTGDKEDVHLSRQGQQRGAVLDQLFVASQTRPDPFPTPDFIFAASHHPDSQRPVETVTPLARKLKLSINDRYDSKLPGAPGTNDEKGKPAKQERMAELRDEILGSPRYAGKTILVAWRHRTIPELARTLKAGKVPEQWGDLVFDRVWQITYDDQGAATFRDRPQRLLPGDAAK
jgi:hypothetical protein